MEFLNSARVGLAGYFFSKDPGQIWRVAESMEVNFRLETLFRKSAFIFSWNYTNYYIMYKYCFKFSGMILKNCIFSYL